MDDGSACVFCPSQVSSALHQYLSNHQVSVTAPRRAIFGSPHPTDELIVALSLHKVSTAITDFVQTLPEVAYERDSHRPTTDS
jgi:hypothetical protein